ncbi:CDP-glucose 4,6-dehydratase [soil metagenome]
MGEFWNGKRVLITGHTGFKGSWLTLWLTKLGAEVCGYSLAPDAVPNLFEDIKIEGEIRSVIEDIRDLTAFSATIGSFQPEIVIHLAAQSLVMRSYRDPVETYSTNLMGTVNVLEAVRKVDSVRSVVVVTTDKVYENGGRGVAFREDEKLGGFDPYSSSKACAELAVASYRNSFFADSETLIATTRAGNVIGGGDWCETRLFPDIFRSLIFGEKLVIRNPSSIRPWQHVLDPLAGYLLLAERLYGGERGLAASWNFGPSENDAKPVRWILNELKSIWNGPVSWEIAYGKPLHEEPVLKLDSGKARNELVWTPKLELSDAIRMTVEWYRVFNDKGDLRAITSGQIDRYENGNAHRTA